MGNASDLILEYLHKNHTASAAELSRSIQLTKADVRYHLKQLLDSKLIEKAVIQMPSQKGRPTQLFRIARQTLPGNYSNLVKGFLQVLNESGSRQEVLNKLAVFYAKQIPQQKSPTQQINRLAAFLCDHGYMARWEAYTNGPRILFRNCPYAQILPENPELCSMDAGILSIYLGQQFEQTDRIDLEHVKIPACVFLLKTPTLEE